MSTLLNTTRQQSAAPAYAALMNTPQASPFQRLLRDLQHLSAPFMRDGCGVHIDGAHSAEVPAILNLSPIAQAVSEDGWSTNTSDRDILLVKTQERLLTGARELTFMEGRLQPAHPAPVGSSITSTFTMPMIRG